jgi:hypothetical protein
VHFWHDLFTGNLGVSTSEGMAPVTAVIRGALPWTLGLVGLATLLSFVLGTLIGVLVAWRRGTWLDQLLPIITFFQPRRTSSRPSGHRPVRGRWPVPVGAPADSDPALNWTYQRWAPTRCCPRRRRDCPGVRPRHAERDGHHDASRTTC